MLTKQFILTIVFSLVAYTISAATWHVRKVETSGDGLTWNTAFASLQDALSKAQPGDQIWVAVGTYHPSIKGDRSATFAIPSGVQVYGGFSGVEKSLADRRLSANPTILCGSNGTASVEDDAYSVVTFKNAQSTTILDGFFIQGGRANAELDPANPHRCGGGIFNAVTAEGKVSNPTLRNLVVRNNTARDGAGVYNFAAAGEASPSFEKVEFQNNISDLDGGAVYNDARLGGACNPAFVECFFVNNMATYGAAIFTATGVTTPNLHMDTVSFNNNVAYLRGGALFSLEGEEKVKMETANVSFHENYPSDSDTLTDHNQHASKMTFGGR